MRAERLLTLLAVPALVSTIICGCTAGPGDTGNLHVDLGKSDPERLMRFYMGAIDGAGGDSILAPGAERLAVRHETLTEYAGFDPDRNNDKVLDWDELTALVEQTYNADGRIPETLDALREQFGFDDSSAFVVEVVGTMSVATRRIYVPRTAIVEALRHFDPSRRAVIYAEGTTIVAEHLLDGRIAEVTAMTKRADGYWDFFVYGADGRLADSTSTEPRPLHAPIQCAGCHFGNRTFEPEKSFPAVAPDGPDGPRLFLSDTPGVTTELVSYFDEHRRRNDTVLGIYATLYVGRLIDRQRRGTISAEERALLDRVGAPGTSQ